MNKKGFDLFTYGALNPKIKALEINVTALQEEVYTPDSTTPTTTTASIFSLGSDIIDGQTSEFAVKGNTVNQDVINGDFSNGTTGWTNGTSVTNNILTVNSYRTYTGLNTPKGSDIYFLYAKARWTAGSQPPSFGIGFTGEIHADVVSPVLNTWYEVKYKTTSVNLSTGILQITTTSSATAIEIDGNAGVFAINMTANGIQDYTEEQMLDLVRQGYWEGTKSTLGGVIKSVGKNLFDKNTITNIGFRINEYAGSVYQDTSSSGQYCVSDYIRVKPNTSYVRTLYGASAGSVYSYAIYNINKEFISGYYTQTIFIPSNGAYIRVTANTNSLGTYQLEEGTTTTDYVEHEFSEAIYTIPFNSGELTRVTNGSADSRDMNTGIATQRNKKYVLQSGDITGIATGTNVQYITIPLSKFSGVIAQSITLIEGNFKFLDKNWVEIGNVAIDTAGNENKFRTDSVNLNVAFALGTYANLAAAQADLAGTEIIYQLATPVKYDVPPQALEVFKSGTVYWQPYKKMTLDGSLSWSFGVDYTGFKTVRLTGLTDYLKYNIADSIDGLYATKYTGKQLTNQTSSTASDSISYINSALAVSISIADTDSGWGETYTPSVDEIQAYFYGWKMNNGTFGTAYNGTGTKTWTRRSATSNNEAVTTVPATRALGEGMYTLGYEVKSELSTIPSITHSEALNLVQGYENTSKAVSNLSDSLRNLWRYIIGI